MAKFLKKLLLIVTLLLIVLYFFLSRKIEMVQAVNTKCAASAATRVLGDISTWRKWWPKSDGQNPSDGFIFKGAKYELGEKYYNGISVSIDFGNVKLNGRLSVFHLSPDSTAITWMENGTISFNPIKRISQLRESKKIQEDLTLLLGKLGIFLSNRVNIYGVDINQTSTTDTLLIFTSFNFPAKPSYTEIYGLVGQLQKFATSQGSKQTGDPLLNISISSTGSYITKLAIPVDRYLNGNAKIESKRMVPGNFLMARVIGGEDVIREAFSQMRLFMQDYNKTEIAIPFQYMITNRLNEPNSSKWITKIFQPIYY